MIIRRHRRARPGDPSSSPRSFLPRRWMRGSSPRMTTGRIRI